MRLVDYSTLFMQANLKNLPTVSGGIHHPLHLRRLVNYAMHDSRGREFKVQPSEIMGVDRLNQNGNLQVTLIPADDGHLRTGYVNANDPWQVECYSPEGQLVRTITSKDCPPIN